MENMPTTKNYRLAYFVKLENGENIPGNVLMILLWHVQQLCFVKPKQVTLRFRSALMPKFVSRATREHIKVILVVQNVIFVL